MGMPVAGERRTPIGMFCINSPLITNIQNMQGENCSNHVLLLQKSVLACGRSDAGCNCNSGMCMGPKPKHHSRDARSDACCISATAGVHGQPGGDESPEMSLYSPEGQHPHPSLWWNPRAFFPDWLHANLERKTGNYPLFAEVQSYRG